MPVTAYILKGVRVVLEYGMLLWLLWFVTRLARAMFREVRQQHEVVKEPEVQRTEAVVTVLEAQEPELQGQRFAFAEEITFGRGAGNDVLIPENFVSHKHATIYQQGNQYVIEDLGSRNSTYVNGEPLQGAAYLQAGDEIRIGMVVFQFER